ncbi:MAG: L,D-transpeptidase family protein [Pseudomonadota bacterium]
MSDKRMFLALLTTCSLLSFACLPGTSVEPDDAGLDAGASDLASADLTGPDLSGRDLTAMDTSTGSDRAVAADSAGHDASSGVDAGGGFDATLPTGTELNDGWIGGACATPADCDLSDFNGTAECETTGFDNGFCTQACFESTVITGRWVCPDSTSTGYGAGTGYTVTRCITTTDGSPTCVAQCDYEQSASGCRPGYVCVLKQRHNEPDSIFPVCLPEATQTWPGATPPANDIGAACTADTGCANLSCMDSLPGGYCTKTMCNVAGCPSGSACYRVSSAGDTACIKTCTQTSQCRQGEGYICDSDHTCWPDTTQPPPVQWDQTVGAPGCAAAWPNNLSPCDLVPDDYLVIDKSARNLALCNAGNLVQNFNIGITPAPYDVGDKVREGDGRTPEGVFYVASLIPNSSYYKAFLISYPDSADADRGLAANPALINQGEHDAIDTAQQACDVPPQTTSLGSYIEVHGNYPGYDWTVGCVSVSDANMDLLWAVIGEDDSIVINP